MKRFLLSAILLLASVTGVFAQTSGGPRDLGFAYAKDYNNWAFKSTGSVAAGAATVIIQADAFASTPDGRTFYPISTTVPLLIEAGNGSSVETVTPSAVTCPVGGLQGTCSFTATFGNAHTGPFTIQSGTYGICEAAGSLSTSFGNGTVVVANGYGGSTSTITSATLAGACKSATINILDARAGSFNFYASNGSVYVLSLAPISGATAPATTAATAVGTPWLFEAQTQSTNYGLVSGALGANTAGVQIAGLKTRSTNAAAPATTTIVTGDNLLTLSAYGAEGTAYVQAAAIKMNSTGTVATTRVPSTMVFQTSTDAAPSVLTTALTIGADQKATFAAGVLGTTLTLSSLTSGRVPIAGTSGLLGDDSDMTFATDTLTVTKLIGSTSLNTPLINNTAGALALTTTTSGNITLNPAAAATAAVTTAARHEMAKGSTVVTGSCVSGDCVLGGDGNFFLISGTTSVDGFATAGWQAGSLIVLTFDGNLTLNNAGTVAAGFADLRLVGGANVSATANDLMLMIYDGTSWMQAAPTLVK